MDCVINRFVLFAWGFCVSQQLKKNLVQVVFFLYLLMYMSPVVAGDNSVNNGLFSC